MATTTSSQCSAPSSALADDFNTTCKIESEGVEDEVAGEIGLDGVAHRLGARNFEQNAILTALRKQTNNLLTRLLSIEHDTRRVLHLHSTLRPTNNPDKKLPLFANARAGCWYIPTTLPSRNAPPINECAFKSADGHYGHWASSPRRPNLHVLSALLQHGVVIVADATRAGKRIPDALSKTLPIWTSVVNALLQPHCIHYPTIGTIADCTHCLAESVHLHPSITPSEHTHITNRLPAFIAAWHAAGMHNHPIIQTARRKLRNKPLRVLWTQPSRMYASWPDGGIPIDDLSFTPVVALSASDAVPHGERAHVEGVSSSQLGGDDDVYGVAFPGRGGFPYVQGAGDDEEGWACGLTPDVFWRHRLELLADLPAGQSEAVDVVTERVRRLAGGDGGGVLRGGDGVDDFRSCFVTPPQRVWECGICIGRIREEDVPSLIPVLNRGCYSAVLILGAELPLRGEEVTEGDGDGDGDGSEQVGGGICVRRRYGGIDVFAYPLTDHRGKREKKYAFGRALGHCLQTLRERCVDSGERVVVCCTSSTGDWAAGVVIAWLAWHCKRTSDDGVNVEEGEGGLEGAGGWNGEGEESEEESERALYELCGERREGTGVIGKDVVHETMIRFLSSFPKFHLSRATLKQLNRFFSSPAPSSSVDVAK